MASLVLGQSEETRERIRAALERRLAAYDATGCSRSRLSGARRRPQDRLRPGASMGAGALAHSWDWSTLKRLMSACSCCRPPRLAQGHQR